MSKDNDAVIELFGLLESRYAIRIIWALADGHPQTFRLLQDSVGGVTPNTLNTRIKELRAAHLVDHNGSGYRLTPLGVDLSRRLGELKGFAGRWGQHVQRSNNQGARSAASARPAARAAP